MATKDNIVTIGKIWYGLMGISRFPDPSPIQIPIPIGLYTLKEHQRIRTFPRVSEVSEFYNSGL